MLLTACEPVQEPAANETEAREYLASAFLLGSDDMPEPAPTVAYVPQLSGAPSNRFEGRLTIEGSDSAGHLEIVTDMFGLSSQAKLNLDTLPRFDFEFVQSGNDLIPIQRGRQRRDHPHWEIIVEPGKVWDEPGDGEWTRASLPFALAERNANCTHNGLMSFLFKDDGNVSQIAFQVGSESCYYLQFNLWGIAPARYQPQVVAGKDSVINSFEEELAARLPVKQISQLAEDFPQADISQFALHDTAEVSTYGFVIDGVRYSGGCPTRFGPYPYCDRMVLPSYSLAKTIFAASAFMQLEQHFPGAGGLLVTDYVPACRLDGRWEGVTLNHLLDMSSGNFESTADQEDEFFSYNGALFGRDNHAAKIADACSLFPRRAEPGSTWVYHTSETYIAGTLMNAFWREQTGEASDIFTDLMVENLLEPLKFSPVLQDTVRSYDEAAQPFTGYGLTLLPDDIARFGLFLLQSDGTVNQAQVLNRRQLDAALQRDSEDPGMTVDAGNMRYNNGLWAAQILPPDACPDPVWIPFMSGYGGISVVLMPNDSVYYVFSDGGHFKWAQAAVQSHKLKSFCGEQP